MKIKSIFCILLVFQCVVQAKETKKKPSWSEAMPERESSPSINVQIEKDNDFGLDRNSLGFDRGTMSDTDDSRESKPQQMTNKIEIQKQLDNERKKNAAQQLKIKKLEAEKQAALELAEQKQMELQRQERREQIEKQKVQTIVNQEQTEEKKQPVKKLENQKQNKTLVKVDSVKKNKYKWKKIKNVNPIYPSKAVRKKQEGWVDIEVIIDARGKVVESRILQTKRNIHVFDKSALKAVRQWKFDPPSNYGIKNNLIKDFRLVYQL